MSKYLGDFAAGDTIDFKFTTFRPSTGAAYTLGGTPAISVYKDNSTTQSTAGITLTADFDSVTGLNHVRITTSSDGTFYANGSQFEAVITAGTVDSVSVVGACVGRFTLAAQTIKAVTNIVTANVTQISGDSVAADNLESYTDGTTPMPVNAIQISGDATAADNLEAAADGTGYNLGGGQIVAASVSGAVNSVTTGVTVATNNDKTGYSLATAPPTAAAIADAVWDETLADHLTSGSTGAALNAAGSSGDPWATSLPGAYGAGTAGKIVGDNLNATVSSRSTLDASGVRSAVGLASANLDTQLDALPTAAENADAVWDEAMSGHTTAGTYGGRIPRSDSSNVEVKITGSAHIAADVHEFQPDVIDAAAIAANAIDASALATDAVTEIAQGVLSEATSTNTATYAAGDVGNVLGRLHNMIEADGADFRYTANALEEAPSGGGGGTTFATGNVPYQVRADEQFPGGVVDILIGTLIRLDLQVLDRDGNAINLTGATVTVGVRNASTGATVGTDQSASLSLARLGYITVDTVADWSATAGTYRLTVSATVGSDVIVAGPLQLIVRAR
jgi:hypothetical protein